jgi:hypothetical protein
MREISDENGRLCDGAWEGDLEVLGREVRSGEQDAGDHKGPHPSSHATPAPTDGRVKGIQTCWGERVAGGNGTRATQASTPIEPRFPRPYGWAG